MKRSSVSFALDIPQEFLAKWQRISNLLAQIFQVPAALIMRVHAREIEVFVASHSAGNPYEPGEMANLNTGLYCEEVMTKRHSLLVADALKDSRWRTNPDVSLGMIYYLGYPLEWPDGQVFGTICVLDRKDNPQATAYQDLLREFKEAINSDLKIVMDQIEKDVLVEELKAAQRQLEALVNQRTRELKESQEVYRDFFKVTPIGITLTSMEGKLLDASPSVVKMFGFDNFEAMRNIPVASIYENEKDRDTLLALLDKGDVENFEIRFKRKDGTLFWASLWSTVQKTVQGESRIISAIVDITQRKLAEARQRQSLKEKEVLLRELYHRTKNNMQVISSLLRLRSRQMKDEKAVAVMEDLERKIKTLSLVHEKLYESKDLSHINLKEYIVGLMEMVHQYYDMAKGVDIQLDLVDSEVLLDTAMPLGLVLNELLSNSLAHAFPKARPGHIVIQTQVDDTGALIIQYSDDGVGLSDDFNPEETDHLGIKTIFNLVEHQLQGKVLMNNHTGLYYKIILKKEVYHPRI